MQKAFVRMPEEDNVAVVLLCRGGDMFKSAFYALGMTMRGEDPCTVHVDNC